MKKTGLELIAIERKEQMKKHAITISTDANFNRLGQLSHAAAILCIPIITDMDISNRPLNWNPKKWLKMVNKSYEDRLIIAGALLAAEIDRLQHKNKCEEDTN